MSSQFDFFQIIQEDYAQNELKCCIKRIKRRSFTTFQEEKLEEAFQNGPYLSRKDPRKFELCQSLDLTETQVSVWFAKRRFKERACHPDNGSKRKFPPEIIEELEEEYLQNNYPKRKSTVEIAERLGLTLRQVQKWFTNRRGRQRRMKKIYNKGQLSEEEYYRNSDPVQLEDIACGLGLSAQEAKIEFSERSNKKKVTEFDDETLVKYIANIRPEEVDDLIGRLEKYFNQNGLFDF